MRKKSDIIHDIIVMLIDSLEVRLEPAHFEVLEYLFDEYRSAKMLEKWEENHD